MRGRAENRAKSDGLPGGGLSACAVDRRVAGSENTPAVGARGFILVSEMSNDLVFL